MIINYLFLLIILLIIFEYKLIKTLNSESRNYIIELHNKLRSELAQGQSINKSGGNMPFGKNIKQMNYSIKLENIAQNWANKCTYSHSENGYGECFSAFPAEYNETEGLKNACNGWWSELLYKGVLGPEGNNTFIPMSLEQNSRGIGHWSQMAWWNSNQVGCGIGHCNPYKTYIVCNYDPPGNVITLGIYEIGIPCSDCINKCNSTSKLCLN